MKLVVAAVMAGGCFYTPVMHFGGGKTHEEAEHDQYAKATPPVLITNEHWAGDVSSEKIRVYADDDYRAQNVGWQHTFEDELAYANEVLAPMLGIKLVAEYREWPRHAPDATIEDDLHELSKLDPGNDVFAVVGLTSALALVSATFELLGIAQMPGRHLMLRGYADGGERAAFDRYFTDIDPGEREALYKARRRHKLAAVLLHELGHNLGMPHEVEADTIMNKTYSDHSASFSAHARETMLATVDLRLHRKSATPQKPARARLVVRLDHAGHASVGGKELDDPTLDELMRLTFADDRETEIVVQAGHGAPRAQAQQLIERAKAAGFAHVTIEVDDMP